MSKLDSYLPSETAAGLVESIVGSLRKTYNANAARHDELLGDDAMTFGVLNWRNGWHGVEEALADFEGVRCSRARGSLDVEIGPARLHFYGYSGSERNNIDAFPFLDGSKTKQRIPISNQLSLALDWGDDEPETRLVDLICVHTGNPLDGLCSIWIGAPIQAEDGVISWAWVDRVWMIDRTPDGQRGSEEASRSHKDLDEPDIDIELRDDAGDEVQESQSA